jgi:hypothetical protein
MPRPRLDETTVEAVTRMANREAEIDVTKLDMDNRLRLVLHKAAKREAEETYGEEGKNLKKAAELTEEYDV